MTSPRVDGVTQQIRSARRNIAGLYPESTLGRLAIDGEPLDEGHRGFATSRAWRDPRCPLGQCWLPEKVRLVPPDRRRCVRHGQANLPADDPFPLEGEERRLAELDAWHAAMPKYHVPIIYADVSFESRLPTPALEGARAAYERHECRGVMLEGSVGSGKTTALRALLRARVVEDAETGGGGDIRWFDFTHLSRLLLDRDQQRRTMDAALECDLLLCDDMGAGHVKRAGFVTSALEEIILHREQHRYPVVATTNLEPRAFRALFGERIYDRWRGSWGVWLNVSRPSLRRKRPPRP